MALISICTLGCMTNRSEHILIPLPFLENGALSDIIHLLAVISPHLYVFSAWPTTEEGKNEFLHDYDEEQLFGNESTLSIEYVKIIWGLRANMMIQMRKEEAKWLIDIKIKKL